MSEHLPICRCYFAYLTDTHNPDCPARFRMEKDYERIAELENSIRTNNSAVIATLEAENLEQARLLGISGSKELALLGRIALLEKVAEAAIKLYAEPLHVPWDGQSLEEALRAAGYLGGAE